MNIFVPVNLYIYCGAHVGVVDSFNKHTEEKTDKKLSFIDCQFCLPCYPKMRIPQNAP